MKPWLVVVAEAYVDNVSYCGTPFFT